MRPSRNSLKLKNINKMVKWQKVWNLLKEKLGIGGFCHQLFAVSKLQIGELGCAVETCSTSLKSADQSLPPEKDETQSRTDFARKKIS
jgi:hypothetical protein